VCGGTIRAEMSTNIEVPNLSTNGPITCVWEIISVGNLLSYAIDTLNIESDNNDNCTKNYVEVAEVFSMNGMSGPDAIVRSENHKRYCGTNVSRTSTISTASDQLQVTFNSTRNLGRASQKYFKMYFRTIYQGR
jgi:CUB domain